MLQNDPFSDPKLYVQTWLIKESIFTASTMITQSASVCNDLAKTCRWCDLKKKNLNLLLFHSDSQFFNDCGVSEGDLLV